MTTEISHPGKRLLLATDLVKFLIGAVMTKYILTCLCVIGGLCVGLLAASCKETPPEPSKQPTLSLNAEDASCTETWLKVSCTELPATIRLQILTPTTQTKQTIRLTTTDTLLIDEGLLPNRTYTYQLQRLNADSTVIETSASVQVTTMDTTSHNFAWRIDTLGTHSSILYDVAIINDTLAYAVGEIFHRDSSENWTFFNLAKWNGREWTLQRVYYRDNTIIHTQWILAFNQNDIWITPYTHWDGTAWHEVPYDPIFNGIRTNKAWGTSSRDFYVVGDGGFIAHYDGSAWRRVESGTNVAIHGVYGARGASTTQPEIICVVSDHSFPQGGNLLRISQSGATRLSNTGLPWSIDEIWFVPNRKYLVAGDGLYWAHRLENAWQQISGLPPLYTTSAKGSSLNDVFAAGAFWNLLHFNGLTWQSYFPFAPGSFTSIQVRGNIILAVGGASNKAIAVRGQRERSPP